jgi:hypothetical protein
LARAVFCRAAINQDFAVQTIFLSLSLALSLCPSLSISPSIPLPLYMSLSFSIYTPLHLYLSSCQSPFLIRLLFAPFLFS